MAVLLASMALIALLVARAVGAGVVAEHSVALSDLDESIADVEVAQVLMADALLLAVDVEVGTTDAATLAQAIDTARQRLGDLRADAPPGIAAVGRYADAGFAMLDLLAAGDVAAAEAAAEMDVLAAYGDVRAALGEARAAERAAIDDAAGAAGIVATGAGVVVVLALPLLIVAGYRASARRQALRAVEETRRRAAGELEEAMRQADADVLRAKDDFLAHVSHELRTPLTSIVGFAQVLEEGSLYDPVTGLELVNIIIGQTGELTRMIDDLLIASRSDAGALVIEIEPVELRREIRAVTPAYERYGSAIAVRSPQVKVMADPPRLRHIIRSLVANAYQHGATPIEVEVAVSGDMVTLAVVDHGDGVRASMLDRLFGRFVHEGDQALLVGSVGLGLAVARDLAKRMGGEIRYERVDGTTRFELDLVAAPNVEELFPDDRALRGGAE